MPLVMGTVIVAVCVAVAVGLGASGEWGPGDQLALVALGAGIAAFLWRYARIRAVPDAEGLTVCNLVVTRRVTWDEVVEVRFPEGAPWMTLSSTTTTTSRSWPCSEPTATVPGQRPAGSRRSWHGTGGRPLSPGP